MYFLPLVLPLRPVRPVDMSVLGSLSAQRGAAGARLVGRGPVRVGSVARVGPLPLVALPVSFRVSASSSFEYSDAEERVSAMPPPPAERLDVGGSRSKGNRDRSPQPGPSGLGSGSQSATGADRPRSEYGGRSSPAPSGVVEDDRSSTFYSVDLDQDDSFQAVLRLIREFHSMEEPASVAPNWCKTSLALVCGLQSEPSPALHLPLSPLLRSLLEDTNSALFKFVEDQTVHGFLPVSSCLYTVLPGLASITLDKVSELRNHSVSLSHSQETMLSSVCEVTSWLDWWLSTCGDSGSS